MEIPIQTNPESAAANSPSDERITLPELQRIVRATDSAALLVLPRILRRVIKQDRRLVGFAYRIPHRKSYVIDREPLLAIVDYEELGLSPEEGLPDKVILLAQPSPQKLAAMSAGDALLRCWRLLFHARVHLAVQQCFVLGFLSASQLRKRIHRIGEAEFEEIRAVLQQEGYLLPPRDDATVYEEFAAVFFELKYFAWNSLPRCFPDLNDLDRIAAVLELDVNAQGLFAAAKPRGAPEPVDQTALNEIAAWAVDLDDQSTSPPLPSNAVSPSPRIFRELLRRAQRPSSLGNVVRASIWRAKALRYAPADWIARTNASIRDDVNQLIIRLQAALELDNQTPQPWHDALRALVYSAADGFWTAEGRLLYDLQKVCIDHEREIYSVNLLGWLGSSALAFLGRIRNWFTSSKTPEVEVHPIKRPLPNQCDVLKSQHLRSAERRLTAVRLSEKQRKQLGRLLRTSIDLVESHLRERFRPLLLTALDEVGLTPDNFPEKIARDKLVEELLDQVAERGFLSIGDLRDALSRNNMKLPDFAGMKDLTQGDPLLKADHRLSEILRGVYRPAEIYLRWLQQLTLLGFGTRIGRFLTMKLVVPLAGAFVIHKGLDHLFAFYWAHIHFHEQPLNWLPLACLLFGLVNVESFRRQIRQSLKDCSHFLGDWVFQPLWRIIHSHIVQVILHNRAFRLLFRFVIKPAAWTALFWSVYPLEGIPWHTSAGSAVSLFLSMNLLLNSRFGRTIEEMTADWAVQFWQHYGLRFILGMFWWMVDLFKTFLETVERLMYSVDEWLRFKSGDSEIRFAAKAVLGLGWSSVAYVVRFCVNLLIEPQINPIKHFPVVTVSHKLLLPLIQPFGALLSMHMEVGFAYTVAPLVIWCIPGIFGFLVWELKENWRLYAANRPQGLQPMIIGSHGESMGRLLKPGLHSGTIPKLFAKLRRAERKARISGNWRAVRKHLHGLHHVEESIRRYVERDFAAHFNECRSLFLPQEEGRGKEKSGEYISSTSSDIFRILLQDIQLGSNRVRLIFAATGIEGTPLVVEFEVQSGWLVGGIGQFGWAQHLADREREELTAAILGLYKTAGTEMVRQQIEASLPAPIPAYDISSRELQIWLDISFETEVIYVLDDAPLFSPQVIHGTLRRPLPTLERTKILFEKCRFPGKIGPPFGMP